MQISVQIIPNAKKSEIASWDGSLLRVRISAPAVEGRANKELIRFLADFCDCSQSEIEILKGSTSRRKRLEIPRLPL